MATRNQNAEADSRLGRYKSCIITPMTRENGHPIVQPVHLLDAGIVASIVFFSTLLGDIAYSVSIGQTAYLSFTDLVRRLPTAGIAFFLTFFAQWARYRGIETIRFFSKGDS